MYTGMGEFSTQAALHTVIINPKHTAIVALSQPTPVVAESPVDVPASTTAAQEAASPVATEVEPTPTLAATPSADDLFGVASSTAVKVVYVPESVESNLSSVGAGRLATPTYESAASPTVSAAFVSNVATATSSALDEVVRSTTDDTFSPQSQGEIAVVSTAEP